MKKGLRLDLLAGLARDEHSNRRPDEEGIETCRANPSSPTPPIPTADLMKKGLRLVAIAFLDAHSAFQPQT